MNNKDKLNRLFLTECCAELTIISGSSDAERHISMFDGHYKFVFDEDNLDQIKKGFFVFKNRQKEKYIFKSQDGIWMVRYIDPHFDITYRKSIYNARFKHYTLDWFQTKWYC